MAQADSAPTTDCPAARLARDAERIIAAWRKADEADPDALAPLEEALDAAEDACSYVRAVSPLGAFYQTLLANADLVDGATWVNAGVGDRMARRLRRLMGSIAGFVEVGTDRVTAQHLREYYLSRERDELTIFDGYLQRGAAQ